SVGLPLMYRHWSFGKHFAREETLYRRGYQGLAYEIVINSSPCISYIMEENSMAMQTLVVAHAAFGHNHFFKNNFLFRQWTDATGILDYLTFARDYVAHAEEHYGTEDVERTLDAAHALMSHGVHRYARRPKLNLEEEKKREEDRRRFAEETYDDIWRTAQLARESASTDKQALEKELAAIRQRLGLPEENLLYFLEKRAPRLKPWQRELVRIVRHVSQYFYPQKQTKMMNEGCATFCHYEIVNRLHEKGLISDGALLEIMHSHTSVVTQPDYDDQRYSGINPYALGFAMMRDIKRICVDPSHEERGYREIRRALARQYDLARHEPDIQIRDVDLEGDRCLVLSHAVHDGVLLDEASTHSVLEQLSTLWHYGIRLEEVDAATERVLKTHEVPARH